jgi:hypothetical protein
VFIAGCPLSLLLTVLVWASGRVPPFWQNAVAFCLYGIAMLGLYAFYLHVTKAVGHLGRLVRSPGLTGAADQTAATQKLMAVVWVCAPLAGLGIAYLPELAVTLPQEWATALLFWHSVLFPLGVGVLSIAFACPLLYWVVS